MSSGLKPSSASLRVALLVAAVALGLAGCGYRGPVQMDKTDTAQQTTATADSGQGKPEGTAAKPHQGFILDGLLR